VVVGKRNDTQEEKKKQKKKNKEEKRGWPSWPQRRTRLLTAKGATASADIVYVTAAKFNTTIPCFNATEPEPEPEPEPTTTPTPSPAPAADGGSGGLSGGAIAGIAIGSVVGASVIGILLFFLYRRDQREKRLAEHRTSARGVKWDEDAASRSRASGNSAGADVELQDVGSRTWRLMEGEGGRVLQQ
jgi:hypothetical protein